MPFEAPKPDNDGPASTFEGNNGSGVLVRALTPLRSMTETSRAETGAAVAGAPMPGTDMKSGVDADCPAACPAASVGDAPKPGNAGPERVLEGGERMAAPTRASKARSSIAALSNGDAVAGVPNAAGTPDVGSGDVAAAAACGADEPATSTGEAPNPGNEGPADAGSD